MRCEEQVLTSASDLVEVAGWEVRKDGKDGGAATLGKDIGDEIRAARLNVHGPVR